MLTRQTHWATRGLHGFLREQRSAPFAWGSNDCCMFAANAIESYTGVDIAADFRGKYHDEASAFALIKTVTGAGLDPRTAIGDAAAYCAAKHGLAEWPHPLQARRGDLVVVENGGRLIAGIVHLTGRHVVSISEGGGPVKLSILAIKRAWHV
jgi:hypothetical protein